MPGTEVRSREKLKFVYVGRRAASVKIRTHNSKEPMLSLTEVNSESVSNPTVSPYNNIILNLAFVVNFLLTIIINNFHFRDIRIHNHRDIGAIS